MATTINSYSVKLGMDAAGFVDATKVSRSEARALIRDIEAAQNPLERFAVEQDRLKRALDSGAISQDTFNRVLESKRTSILGTTAAINPYTAAVGAITTGVAAASAATVAFVGHMRSVQNTIDDAADKAERLGLKYTELRSLEYGFDKGGGVNADAVGEAVKKLQINLAKAVQGDQGVRDAFARLGIDAGQLMSRGPREAMLQLADAMAKVAGPERLKLAVDVLGKGGADLASTLGKGRQELEESMQFAQKWLGLTEQQVAMIGSNNDAWKEVYSIVDGVTNLLAAELAPVMELVAGAIKEGAEGVGGIGAHIRSAVDSAVLFAGFMQDAFEYVAMTGLMLNDIANADFSKFEQRIKDAYSFDSGEKMLANLNSLREGAELEAASKAIKRMMERHSMALEDTDKEKSAKLKAIDDVAKEEQRRQAEKERQANRNAEEGLRAAERYFEEERKKQMKMREDVAKGPGSGMEAGSAEAARFMAEQANRAIAESTVKVDAKPTDEQLVEQAKIQVEIARANSVRQEELINAVRDVGRKVEENAMEGV